MSETPFHQLTNSQTKLWICNPRQKRQIAATIAVHYPQTGCGVLAWRGQHIAWVNPKGSVIDLPPPFQRYERHAISNAPPPSECACRDYYDPESHGPWGARDDERSRMSHHPFCQFNETSAEVYNQMIIKSGQRKSGQKLRPDAAIRLQDELLGKRTSKTGARSDY